MLMSKENQQFELRPNLKVTGYRPADKVKKLSAEIVLKFASIR